MKELYIIKIKNIRNFSMNEERYIINLFNTIEVDGIIKALPEASIERNIMGNEKVLQKIINNINKKYDLHEVNIWEYEAIIIYIHENLNNNIEDIHYEEDNEDIYEYNNILNDDSFSEDSTLTFNEKYEALINQRNNKILPIS